MKKLLKVGITLRVENITKYNEKRDAISQDWIRFCNYFKMIPVLIPNNLESIKKFLEMSNLDILIFSGGDNVGDDPGRDKTEKTMLKFALENKIPSLGICRGMQFFNIFFGGDIRHSSTKSHVKTRHRVEFSDKKIEKLLSKNHTIVNSFHQNFIEEENLGTNLKPFGIVKDNNTIEAFYHKKYPIIGVMWHPEREADLEKTKKLLNLLQTKKIWK